MSIWEVYRITIRHGELTQAQESQLINKTDEMMERVEAIIRAFCAENGLEYSIKDSSEE